MKHAQLIIFCIIFLLSCSKKQEKKKIKRVNNTFYNQAQQYHINEKFDSAFIYFNKAKDLSILKKDSIGVGRALIYMGMMLTDQGDHYGAQETLLDAFDYFNKQNRTHFGDIVSTYSTLGVTASNLRRYPKAIEFYQQALNYTDDETSRSIVEGNMANAYRDNGDYQKALLLYQKSLKQKIINTTPYARLITNIATTKWLQDTNYNAAPELLKALHIREKENDLWGQNSSCAHLVDYYINHNNDSANFYANKRYKLAIKVNSPDDRLDALTKLIKLAPQKESKRYFETYERLNDSLQTARNNAKNQFALVRYDVEKHKKDFLKAEAENIKKQGKIFLQYLALGFLLLVLAFGYFWYRKRKKTLKQEKELEVKNTELKYVKKTHDHVANRVYNLMIEVDNGNTFDKTVVADKLEVIYNISRDLSYERDNLNFGVEFANQLSKMLKSYASEQVQVFLAGNEEELWINISNDSRAEVRDVLQELMTNMSKHSEATEVSLQFERIDNHINIHYTDNGIGLPKDMIFRNGLTNTENRIKSIQGTIIFDTRTEGGLSIQLSFPTS